MFAILLLFVASASAQPLAKQSDIGVYAIPFASESNRIELEIANSTDATLEGVSVEAGSVPTWITLESASQVIGDLETGESSIAVFMFDLDERAPVAEVTELRFEVVAREGHEMSPRVEGGVPHPPPPGVRSASAGHAPDEAGIRDDNRLETRTIRIQPEAPTELTLRGNYPNPFNPTTKIAYALPKDGNVEIEVFNAIGQRVTRLVDQIQEAGYQEATWNAAGVPSGVYFYAIRLDVERAGQVKVGRMVVVK